MSRDNEMMSSDGRWYVDSSKRRKTMIHHSSVPPVYVLGSACLE